MIDSYGLQASQKDISVWYDGYTFGDITKIYNPWSVLNCIRHKGELDKYWTNTSDNVLLKKLISTASGPIKSDLELLLSQQSIEQPIEDSLTFPDLDQHGELLWSLLLFTGYLTYTSCKISKDGTKLCTLVIPNQEIRFLYMDLIRIIFKESVVGEHIQNLIESLLQGDVALFNKELQGFVLNSMSSYDLPSSEPEKSYHLFILGLLVTLADKYNVKSNRESRLGRYDIMLIPKNNQLPGCIIEFKIARPGESLDVAAQKALDQIIQKNYAHELREKNVAVIRAYGIAFEGKQLLIKHLNL
jgi:hypothetical protein